MTFARSLAVCISLAALSVGSANTFAQDSSATTVLGPSLAAAAETPKVAKNKEEWATKKKRFYVRGGVSHVATLESSSEARLTAVDGPASLAIQSGPIAGSGSSVSSATIPSMIVGIRTPWLGGRLSIETVLGLPFTVKFQATGTLASESIAPEALGIETGVPALGAPIGEATAVPPVFTAVYTFDKLGPVIPYLGSGLGVLFTSNARITNPILSEVRSADFNVAPAPGLVLQGGIESYLYKRLFLRIDAKFIALMKARATVSNIAVRTPALPLFETAEVGKAELDVWVNPLILTAGLGLDF